MSRDRSFTVWGDGSAVRDYVHIDDVVEAFARASLIETIPSGIYNVGSGEGHSLNEIIDLAAKVTGKRPIVRYESPRSMDVPKIYLDTEKFRAAAQWAPTISIEDGIRNLWSAIKSRAVDLPS